MKRAISSFVTLMLLVSLILTSSAPFIDDVIISPGSTDTEQGNGNIDDGGNDQNIGQSTAATFDQIVVQNNKINITDIRSEVFKTVGFINTVLPDTEPLAREIVIGDTDRQITLGAKAQLESIISSEEGADSGYIIYSDGSSVAVYWTHSEFASVVLSYFYDICAVEKRFDISSGVVCSAAFYKKDYDHELLWMDLKEEAPEDLYIALRELNALYDGTKTCVWMANLWDVERGGFYYSNSARDNEPFRPDLESTNQLTGWLQDNGACVDYNNQVNNMFPNDLKMRIVDFAKNMQCATDGYFYHPQWPQGTDKLNTDRYGRDLSWGVALINRFHVDRDGDGVPEKQYPNYCTPSGAKCEEHAKNGGSCSFLSAVSSNSSGLSNVAACSSTKVTSGVQSSVSTAVSRLPSSTVKAVVSSKPDYSSSAAFSKWLSEYCASVQDNSGNAHNINALQDEIIAKGFGDEVVDFLEMHQQDVYDQQIAAGETPSGLWQRYPDDYRFVWGILKYMPFYNSSKCGRAIKYPELIVASCMEVIMLPAIGDYAMNDLMNQWSAITAIINNVKNHPEANDPDTVNRIYAMLEERGAELVENCILKLKDFKLDNGTFVYTYAGKAPANIYGVPISLGVREADVNGNSLCSSFYRGMFTCFGYKEVPLCTAADGEMFLETLYSLEPVEKAPVNAADTIDFENVIDLSTYNMVTLDKKTDKGAISIEYDPDDSTNAVMKFSSGVGAQYGDYLRFTASGVGGNCNIAEFDFLLESASKDANLFQVKVGNSYMFTIGKSGNYLVFGSVTGTAAGASSDKLVTTADKIAADEWCKVRVEVYTSEVGDEHPAYIKFFVNDELKGVSTLYYESHTGKTYNSTFTNIQFYSMMAVETVNYFDNIYLSKENKPFNPDSEDTSDNRGN